MMKARICLKLSLARLINNRILPETLALEVKSQALVSLMLPNYPPPLTEPPCRPDKMQKKLWPENLARPRE
jgi:hypothetical protein